MKVSGGGSPGQLPECLGVGASLAHSLGLVQGGRQAEWGASASGIPSSPCPTPDVCGLAVPLCPSDGPSPLIWRANVASVQGGEAWLESVVAPSPDAQFL